MSKYRIIKVKGHDSIYLGQKRILFFFWERLGVYEGSINRVQARIDLELKREAEKRANPRNIVVKTIKG